MLRIIIAFLFVGMFAQAQTFSKAELKILNKKQDSLSILAWRISNEISATNRLLSDSVFTKVLVRSLAIKNSFKFAFDSVQIAKVVAPDSSFRLFTWEVERSKDKIRQRGVVQYKTPDGKLKIVPLIDNSEFMEELTAVNDNRNWIGALYYKILLNEWQGKKYYTLIGFDENNSTSNKKWIEVLTFNDAQQPIFGGPYIQHTTRGIINRIGLEYKKDSKIKVSYDEEQNMIIYDHLSSETGFVNQRDTYVADGDYEGLKWENGVWKHTEKVMCNCPLSTKENKEKVNDILIDKDGNKLEQKLLDKSKKNTGGGN